MCFIVKRGSVLIFAIWILILLTTFAVQIGLQVRQRIMLLSRLETRSQLHYMAEAGIKKAIAVIRVDTPNQAQEHLAYSKFYRHNNDDLFRGIPIGGGTYNVSYEFFEGRASDSGHERYGVVDEESKINVNKSDRGVLRNLIQMTGSLKEEQVAELVDAIIDWREMGESQITSFYSDDYYANLKHPYEPKKADFEVMDELLLVKGFTKEIFEKLVPFITVYGDGKINVNTASKVVLLALGLNESVVNKIVSVRRGFDGIEATVDDYIFQKIYDIPSELLKFVTLEAQDIKQIEALTMAGRIKTVSSFYSVESRADFRHHHLSARCVYNRDMQKVEYWREKF